MKPFFYNGEVSSSKSLMNRALIAQSFFPELEVAGHSQCHDVIAMQTCLKNLSYSVENSFKCGAAGTTFRFLLARLSREEGSFLVEGSDRLFERPQQPLYDVLKTLGANVYLEEKNCIHIDSRGWIQQGPLSMSLKYSSQYISALLLSSWNLPQPLVIDIDNSEGTQSYLQMTIDFLKQMGMALEVDADQITVPANQKVLIKNHQVEPDMSSIFSLACFALISGELTVNSFPEKSLQPDFRFIEILKSMGGALKHDLGSSTLKVQSGSSLQPACLDLQNNPDLFPVLAVLLSRVEGSSELSGLSILVHKESDRIENTKNLLGDLGISCSYQNKKFLIQGKKDHSYKPRFKFDPDQDHRMAMAAALAVHQGAAIDILHPKVVDKSFPEFWEIVKP